MRYFLATCAIAFAAVISLHAQTIQKFEYFIDTDPGYGLGTSASPTPAAIVTDFAISIPTTSLTPGFHRVLARAQDSNGDWTSTSFFDFYIATPAVAAGNVVSIEYFIDSDPGFGAGTAVAITPAATLTDVAIDLSAASLSGGFHRIYVRSKNTAGVWSEAQYSAFYVAPVVPPTNLVKFEYFFDVDPGFDNGLAAPVSPAAPTVTDMSILAVPSSLSQGSHVVYVRAKDSAGNWTAVISQTFVVTPPSCPTATPLVTNGSGCANTAISMSVSGAIANQEYRWYDVSTGGTSLSSAATYAPTLTASATYYVSIYDKVANCESGRVAVTATVNPSPGKPTITAGGPLTFCPGGSVTLSAPNGFANYFWSDAATTMTHVVTTAGSVTVQVADASGCKSVSSDPVTITLFTPPAKPSITGSTDICNGKTVTLSGPAGFTYAWSDGETTASIMLSAETSVTLVVKDANGCSSAASDPKVVACTNVAPEITEPEITTSVGGVVTYNLTTILSDPDNNLDLTTLKIVSQPESGAEASIVNDQSLKIDYSGIAFTGVDRLTLSVCDIDAACASKELSVIVEGEIIVYNGVSPNSDDKNEIFLLKYIDVIPETKENKVTIFNRWGDVVFEIENYNNTTNVFRGISNSGATLPNGNYFYKISFTSGKKSMTGYLSLKR